MALKLEEVQEISRLLEELRREYDAGIKTMDQLYRMSERELDAYSAWQDDVDIRIEMLRNRLRGTNVA